MFADYLARNRRAYTLFSSSRAPAALPRGEQFGMSDFDSAPFEVGRQIIVFLGHPWQHPFGLAVRDRTGQPPRPLGLFPIKSRLLHDVETPARAAFAQWRSFFLPFCLEWFLIKSEANATNEALMATYRCYFLDRKEHIHGSADVEASVLEEAVDLGLEMLKAQYSPKCEFIEIWQGDQRLYPTTGTECQGTDAA